MAPRGSELRALRVATCGELTVRASPIGHGALSEVSLTKVAMVFLMLAVGLGEAYSVGQRIAGLVQLGRGCA